MKRRRRVTSRSKFEGQHADPRLRFASGFITLLGAMVILRLFILMIMQHGFYTALAAGSHEVYAQLFPTRGDVYIQDSRTGEEYPLAMNQDLFTVFADTRLIPDINVAEDVAEALAEAFAYEDERKLEVFYQLQKEDDPYEPIEQRVDRSIVDQLREKDLPGIGFARTAHRFYPEGNLGAHVVGFVGKTEDGSDIGQYGIEGYWQHELGGQGGFFSGERSAAGFWIPLAGRSSQEAVDGSDLLLTIDRTLQYRSCEKLRAASEEFGATSASMIIMNPNTGAIRAMCGTPDFDPNTYNEVESINVYNNKTIFTPYEPGSIFKPMAMAAAINEGALTPESRFFDSGSTDGICTKPIRNADLKIYEQVTMTEVLENSINTGMVHTVEKVGKEKFIEYIDRFGFGVKTGIALDSEEEGNVSTLGINKKDKVDCYTATASFGQGITATPLQMVAAYGAIANGGTLMQPYVVEEVRHADGRVDRYGPREVRRVLDKRTAQLVSGMLVTVVDSGHAGGAKTDGYYLAGKTGTAQIPGTGGYTDETNHSFVGFGPVDDPEFVILVKFEKPRSRFSASTAAPVFGDIARFALQYYQIPPGR